MSEQKQKKDVRRPMNSFIIFCNEYRGVIRGRNPSMDNRDVTRALGDLWANLGDEKNLYMNKAKQKSDAFKMANPGFKWHNKEKSQKASKKAAAKSNKVRCSKTEASPHDNTATQPSDTAVAKPSGSRLQERVANVDSDVCLNPVELAESSMNGQNQTQMSEQDRSESHMSASFLPRETSTPMPIRPVLALSPLPAEDVTSQPCLSPISMLIHALEMGLQEQDERSFSVMDAATAQPLDYSTQCQSAVYSPSFDLISDCYQAQPPPTKPACDLTEALVESAGASTSCPREDTGKQKLPTRHSRRCSDSYYTRMKGHKKNSPRRKPPSGGESSSSNYLLREDTKKSHGFSRNLNESECSMPRSDYSNKLIAASSLANLSLDPRTPQFLSGIRADNPQQLLQHENGAIADEPWDLSRKNCLQWNLQPEMSDKKSGYKCTENLAPGVSSTHNYLPDWKFDVLGGNQPRPLNQAPSLNELKPKIGIFPALSPVNKPFSASSSYTRSTLASLLSKGKAVSLLNNNSTDRQATAGSVINHGGHKTLQKIENIAPALHKQSYGNQQADSQEPAGQFHVAHKSGFVNENDFTCGKPGDSIEPESSLNLPPSQPQNLTPSEEKLKKKWEERMLVEIKQENLVSRRQSAVKHDGKNVATALGHTSKNETHDDHRQNILLDCVTESEQSKEHRAPIVPVKQKPILNQPLDSKSSQVQGLPSCNSSRYVKLRQHLSQNLPFLKPDLQRLQSPFTDVQGKPDISEDKKNVKADICENRPVVKAEQTGLKDFSFYESSPAAIVKTRQKHRSVLAGLREGVFDRFQKDNSFVDYNSMMTASSLVEKVIRQFYNSSPRKDAPRKAEKLTRCDGRQINLSDSSHIATQSDSLASKMIKDISSGISRRSERTRRRVSSCADGEEDSEQYHLSPASVGTSHDVDVSDRSILQAIRKSGRANQGQKYQEFIKEGIIHPSRDRLATRSGEKQGRNSGSREVSGKLEARKVSKPTAVQTTVPADSCAASASLLADNHVEELSISRDAEPCLEDQSLPVCTPRPMKRTLEHSQYDDNSRAQRHCDNNHSSAHMKGSDNHRLMRRCRRNSYVPTDNSSGRVSATSKVDFTSLGGSAANVALPMKDQVNDKIIGSRKRKAMRRIIRRIPFLHEANEDWKMLSSTKTFAAQHKKPRISSELQMVSQITEVPSSSLNRTTSQAQLTGMSSAADVERNVVSLETFITPAMSLLQSTCYQNKTEFTNTPEASFAVDNCQADLHAYSSSDVSVGKNSFMNFITTVNATPIMSCTPIISSTPIMSSTPIPGSVPIMSSSLMLSSTPIMNSLSITTSTPVLNSTYTISSSPFMNSLSNSSSTHNMSCNVGSTFIISSMPITSTAPIANSLMNSLSNSSSTHNMKSVNEHDTGCNSPFHLYSAVDASSFVEENSSTGNGEETFSHVKSVLECTDMFTECAPEITTPRKASPVEWSPSFRDENVSPYTQLYQQDSKQCYDTPSMKVSRKTALRASHFVSLLPVTEVCRSTESPVLKNNSLAREITFTAEPDLTEVLPAQPSTVSQRHNSPSSSRLACSNTATSDVSTGRPSGSRVYSIGNKLSSAYSSSSSAAPGVISLAAPIVNFSVKGTTPMLETVSTSMIGSRRRPESQPVTFVQS